MTRTPPAALIPATSLIGAAFALTALAYGLSRFAFGLLMPQIKAELGLTPIQAGWIGSAGFGAYCIGVVVALLVVPLWGPRRVAVLSGLFATGGLGMIGAAPSGTVVFAGMALAGFSTGLASPPLAAAVARWIAEPRRPAANGLINAGTGAGIMLSGLAVMAFASAWRELYIAFAAMGAAITLWLWLTIPPGRLQADAPTGTAGRGPGVVALGLAGLLMGAGSTAVWTFGADILQDRLAVTDRGIALAWIVLGAAGLTGAVTGVLTDRWGIGAVHRLALGLMGAALAWLAVTGPGWGPLGVMALFGAGYILSTGALLLWGIAIFRGRPDMGLGLAFLTIAAGQSVGAPAFAALSDAKGIDTALWAAVLVMALAALPVPHRGARAVPVPAA